MYAETRHEWVTLTARFTILSPLKLSERSRCCTPCEWHPWNLNCIAHLVSPVLCLIAFNVSYAHNGLAYHMDRSPREGENKQQLPIMRSCLNHMIHSVSAFFDIYLILMVTRPRLRWRNAFYRILFCVITTQTCPAKPIAANVIPTLRSVLGRYKSTEI